EGAESYQHTPQSGSESANSPSCFCTSGHFSLMAWRTNCRTHSAREGPPRAALMRSSWRFMRASNSTVKVPSSSSGGGSEVFTGGFFLAICSLIDRGSVQHFAKLSGEFLTWKNPWIRFSWYPGLTVSRFPGNLPLVDERPLRPANGTDHERDRSHRPDHPARACRSPANPSGHALEDAHRRAASPAHPHRQPA